MLTRAVAALVLVAGALIFGDPTPGCWDTAWRCRDVNQLRVEHDRARLDQAAALQTSAKAWAETMAERGDLRHDPTWDGGEIVGKGTDWHSVMYDEHGFLDSDRHRAIILGDYARVGIGVQRADGVAWVVVRFR